MEGLAEHLVEFVKPYRERVGWISREKHLDAFVAGLVGSSERKSVEPIAYAQGVDRRQLQHFVGVSVWDHLPLLDRLHEEVGQELGDPEGVLVVDGSATRLVPIAASRRSSSARPDAVRFAAACLLAESPSSDVEPGAIHR